MLCFLEVTCVFVHMRTLRYSQVSQSTLPSIGDRDCVSHAPRCQQSWQGTQLHAGLTVNSKLGLTRVCVLGECSFLSNLELQALAACMWLGFLSHKEVFKRLLLLPIPIYHSGI